MELIGILFFLLVLWIFFKLLAVLFSAGAFLITLPFKILGLVFCSIFLIPLVFFGFAAGFIAIVVPLLPVALVILGIVFILRRV